MLYEQRPSPAPALQVVGLCRAPGRSAAVSAFGRRGWVGPSRAGQRRGAGSGVMGRSLSPVRPPPGHRARRCRCRGEPALRWRRCLRTPRRSAARERGGAPLRTKWREHHLKGWVVDTELKAWVSQNLGEKRWVRVSRRVCGRPGLRVGTWGSFRDGVETCRLL